MKILLLGSGGRECAIAWKISQSPRLEHLYVAPGNAAQYGTNVALNPMDFDAVKEFVDANAIDMIVVGPENPLVEGIYDYFADHSVKVIGPSKEAAQLEGSKEFAKEFMFRHHIPTARFMSVTAETLEEGYHFLESLNAPYVLKADGLAAGKGVIILDSLADAKDTLSDMLEGMFGNASATVVIEEFLSGIECSVFVMTDGEDYKLLPVAKDYKRVGEGDTGLNTGGMGSVSPVPFADDKFMQKVVNHIVEPTLKGLKEENLEYRGFIFLGLINVDGDPMVIEYNCRMGDPETEVVMPRLKSDLVDLLEGVADQTLGLKKIEFDERAAVAVMLTSAGYPGDYEKGKVITGLDGIGDVLPFHAGTKLDAEGRVLTNGGRVIALVAYGEDIADAAAKAKAATALVDFEGKYMRNDIANDLLR
ncbi:MAG: phosphoribosylamine--glycine ligase [Muribaculaceae bacterium]|nr:phosphoribosylamine--glycine ligase [Muribaculaceae bacterium]MBO7165453.1 phosphoribosylamine--glycine ligase [Muribaculaceae bacterium]MBQ1184671.1 phosphoribosylamine--glycine ligase [Muribaculaceae bacterium]MBQ2370873.1 phosphoribosylamine--glycine ligase [Muribaculaceae bacterium]MBQ2439882.1 phosphoribosylamine--glycine ligase [Muribaculaceae bacterium]